MNKILIADEDAQLLMILTDSFDKHRGRFAVQTVSNGLEAILALQKQEFAAVVTEIRMPKVNGLVLMGYLAKNYPDVPIIVMTDVYSEVLKKRLIKESIQYIQKPFKVQELADAVLTILDQKETFGGKLKGISVAGFLMLIENEHLSCVCEVSSLKTGKGYFLFKNGILYNAKLGTALGEEAALRMMAVQETVIKFRSLPQKTIPRVIRRTVSELVGA